MIDKVILLTIFIYITLNLRKIENFIQSGCKIENFAAENQKSGKGKQKVDKVALNSGMIWGLIKLSVISLYMLYDTYYHFSKINMFMSVLSIFATIGIGISYLVGALDDITNLTWLETIINEMSLVFGILSLVNMAVSRQHSELKTGDFKKFYKDVRDAFEGKDSNDNKQVGSKDKTIESSAEPPTSNGSPAAEAPDSSPTAETPTSNGSPTAEAPDSSPTAEAPNKQVVQSGDESDSGDVVEPENVNVE